MTAPRLPGGSWRERNQGTLHESVTFTLTVKHGWDSDLHPFAKIRGKGFVAEKCWSLPEHSAQENEEGELGRETGTEVTGHWTGRGGAGL